MINRFFPPQIKSINVFVGFFLLPLSLVVGLAQEDSDAQPRHRCSYFKNGEIHVGYLGEKETQPITKGHFDFKPSWSLTNNKLVFFRRVKIHKDVSQWKTAIHVVNVDGSGLHPLSDGSYTDFNQTWTRDGTNTPIWNRKKPKGGGYTVMASKVGAKPGEEYNLSGYKYHTWAYTCLKDGRILVDANPPGQGRGYYLMKTAGKEIPPVFEKVNCPLAKAGTLARVSLSLDETKVCFEYTKGFERKVPGRTLYLADFDATKPAITKAKSFANKAGENVWFAYPRWTKDQTSIVYHAGKKLYLYHVESGETIQVSTDDSADYRYPHGDSVPK